MLIRKSFERCSVLLFSGEVFQYYIYKHKYFNSKQVVIDINCMAYNIFHALLYEFVYCHVGLVLTHATIVQLFLCASFFQNVNESSMNMW
jgi:hypothetical protein